MLNTHDFNAIINPIIQHILRSGITTGAEKTLVLLTETEPKAGFWYDDFDSNFEYESDARTVTPFGATKLGQRQYLISFDLSKTQDESPKYSPIPVGWTWKIYLEHSPQKTDPIVIVLRKLAKKDSDPTSDNFRKTGEIEGFSMLKLPERLVFPNVTVFDEYAIMIDPAFFTVQIQ